MARRASVWYSAFSVPYPRLSSPDQTALLEGIIARCAASPATRGVPSGPTPVVVFDLDGTLMDNRPRSAAILREAADALETELPQIAPSLRSATADHLAYLLADTLGRLGITRTDHVALVEDFWRARFFRDEHLAHDVALAGAVSFAKACYDAGAVLVYLTGRDLPLMGLGTFKSLRDLGFPIGITGTELVLKPDAAMPDEAFKRLAAPELLRVGRVVAAFDNEPGNCNVFAELYPECASVLVDTQHMPGAPPVLPAVKIIGDFVRS